MRLPLLCLIAAIACASPALAQVTRVGAPTSPILQAAVVPAGSDIIYVSGITPTPINASAPAGTPREFGDTKAQTISVLTKIAEILKGQGATLGDAFMMRVLLVGDPAKDGKMDFAAMNEGYNQFFGTKDQPNKVARITSQVVALAAPGMLVEIEVQAIKPKP
jgi:enamine deaminase RidA (YjgF/YER057c/UK114 family)